MKHFPLFKHLACACGLAATAAVVSSCSVTPMPQTRAQQLAESPAVTVYSYNDSHSAAARVCNEAGPLPAATARALQMWLQASTVKTFSYAYPQYYITVPGANGKQAVWGICSDGQGNLVGILIPRDGVAAWDLPYVGSYSMYVCDTKQRKALSDAIMESLSDAGYDTYRLDTRKASGLTQEQYLISKPLTDAEKARIAELKAKEEAAAKAAEEAAAKAAEEKAADGEEEESSPATPDTVTEEEDGGDDTASESASSEDEDSDSSADTEEETSSEDDDF